MALASCKEIQKDILGTSPSPRQRFAVALQGEDLYLFGGSREINDEVSQYYDDLYKLHVGTKELYWEKVKPGGDIPQGRDDHCMCAVGNRLLLYGGKNSCDAKECLSGLYIFHLGLNAWEDVFTPSTAPRTLGHTMDKVGNNVYMFGGIVGSDVMVDLHLIALDEMKWDVIETKGECPAPRYNHSSTVIQDRYIYYFGGTGGENVLYNDVFIFDTDLCSWICPDIKYDPPKPRSLHSFTNHRDKDIYVFGGQVGNGQLDVLLSGDFYKLSLQDRLKWKTPVVAGSKLIPRSGHVSFVLHSHLYIFGGVIKEGDPFQIHTLKLINPSERDIVVDIDENNIETSSPNQTDKELSTECHRETQPVVESDQQDSSFSFTDKSNSENKSVGNQQDIHNKSAEGQQDLKNNSVENQLDLQEVTADDFAQQDHFGSSEARTSTPISSTSRTISQGKCDSYLSTDISNKHEDGNSTLTSSSSGDSKRDISNSEKNQDISDLQKTTSVMIEDVFRQVKYEKRKLENEKKKLLQDRKTLEEKQEEQETKMKMFESEMTKMLESHQKVMQEMEQKRHLEDEKDRNELDKIQKNIQELKQKISQQ